ncbi:glycosyl transferase family protein [Salinisphaera sp. T5B8]
MHIAVYIPTLAGGGAEQSMLRLAETLAERGHLVDLLVNRRAGAHADRLPNGVRLVELARHGKLRGRLDALRAYPGDTAALLRPVLLARTPVMTLRYLPGLASYLSRAQPAVLVSALFYANLLAIWARRLARVDTRLIVTEHNNLSRRIAQGRTRSAERARWRYLPELLGRVYPRADAIVAVSNGVADDLAEITQLDRAAVHTIHNPVVFPELPERAREPDDHPWFTAGAPPVVLAAGRLEAQKNFALLLDAVAVVRRQRPLRLMILGEGSQRDALSAQAERLGIAADIELRGWVGNPYAAMSRAAAFVLSSNWEGLGNVLIEAMACGCPVVATDCPSGPREILNHGEHGRLVPMNDVTALADALNATLDAPVQADRLRDRAEAFSTAKSADRYLALIDQIA